MAYKNYEILSGDNLVAIWQDNVLTVVNEALLPLYLKNIKNPDMWLETRAIDSHRANSRLLKKALRLNEKDDVSTVIHVNGVTVTDNYWVREIGSKLTYKDVEFPDDYFSNLALNGTYNSFNRAMNSKNKKTPELTNVGSFEKCWKLRDGKWWMYKRANHSEMFSELFIYELGKILGMNMAVYERGNGYIKTLDFTNSASVNFEPASAFMGDNEDYFDVIKALENLFPDAIPDYIKMLYMDTVCMNPDRHTNNFGLLRDVNDGRILGLAPNFDNNMALISRGYPSKNTSNDVLIRLFCELLDAYPMYKEYIPNLKRENVENVLNKLNMRVREKDIIDILLERHKALIEAL